MTKLKFGKPLCRSIIAVAIMMLSLQAMAFSYTCMGKTLEYFITSGSTVEVIGYSDANGNVVIPSSVVYYGKKYNVTAIGNRAFGNCSGLISVTIPNSVTSIGSWAFGSCSGLISVTIPNGVTSIGSWAFSGCISLTSVTIPNSVFFIGNLAFYGCRSLTSVTIPNGVTSIGRETFLGCSGLASVTIGNSVTSIGEKAFEGCSGLTSVTIPNSVTSIGGSAFSGCSGLASVTIGNSVTSIGEKAFEGCSSLTSVTIPNSVTSIGGSAFLGCRGLTSVSIGIGVTSIGEFAFSNCSNLTSVICLASTPPSIGSSSFPGISSTCTLTVSCVSLDAYIGSDWNTCFGGGIMDDTTEEFPFEVIASANDLAAGSVDISNGERCNQRILTATPASCYHFTAWNDGNTNNPRTIRVTQDTTLTANFERAVYTQEIRHAICEGNVYTENGFNVSEAGTYTRNLQTINGCDSIVTLNLTVNPVANTNLTAAICEGATYTENGFNASEAGSYTQTLQTVNGCDSIVTLTLTVNPVASTTFTAAICEGTTYTENGFNVSEAGTYTQNLQTVNGCDSIVTLNLTINPVASTNLTAAICEGTTYTENGFNASEAGTYTQNLQTINGCDSVVTLNLTVNPVESTNLTAAICEGSSYTENGFNVSEAGTYTQNLQTINGCDSIVTLTLTVNPVENTNLSAAICEGSVYTENGFNASEAGTYTQNLQTVNGCDSIVTLNLTISNVVNNDITAAICEGSVYTENGFNASEAGTHTLNLQTINGCDSIVTLTLTVNPVANTTLSVAICEGSVYTENGFNASEAGTYTQNLQTVNGCDSIVTLNLTISNVVNNDITAVICEGSVYTENGFNASEAGTYTQNLQTVNGCDSIVTLSLTVNPVENTNLSAAICDGSVYTENGFNVSEAGTHTLNLQTINGCDSIVTLTLTVNPVANTNLTVAICEGATYTENGFNESETGTYTQNLQTVNGCDSIVTLNLTVSTVINNDITAAICEGSTYTENGFNVSEPGTYTQNLQSVNGCDSVVTLTLTVNPTYNITIDASINEGETYEENGFSESEAGTYVHTLQAENGCDSVITLNLTVNSSLNDVLANAIEVSLYPNPAQSFVNMELSGEAGETMVQLFDIQGKILRTYTLENGKKTLRIDLDGLPAACYYLHVISDNRVVVKKIIKNN